MKNQLQLLNSISSNKKIKAIHPRLIRSVKRGTLAKMIEQMKDNLSFMADFKPLNEHEEAVIAKAVEALNADKSIPCTACHYCTKGCPMSIPIPEIFTVQNRKKGSPEFRTKREYAIVTEGKGKASDCIQCGQCEGACPQHLPIISLLEECRPLEG